MAQQRLPTAAPLALGSLSGRAKESRPWPRYVFHWSSAFLAATLATAAITLYMLFIPRLLGVEEMDIGITIGAMTDPNGGPGAFLARLAWHVGNGLVYAFIYAAVLLFFQRQSNLGTGLVFGVCLWLVGPMTLIPILLDLHPDVGPGRLTNPGIFMLSLGAGWTPAAIDLGAHLIHGFLTGAVYKHHAVERLLNKAPASLPTAAIQK